MYLCVYVCVYVCVCVRVCDLQVMRDCGLVDRRLNPADVDLIFTMSKTKGLRRLQFEQFVDALHRVGECDLSHNCIWCEFARNWASGHRGGGGVVPGVGLPFAFGQCCDGDTTAGEVAGGGGWCLLCREW